MATRHRLPALLASVLAAGLTACSGGGSKAETPVPSATLSPPTSAPATSTAVPPTVTPTAVRDETQPIGFPIDESTRLGLVVGDRGARSIVWDAGPPAREFSLRDQPSADPEAANRSGWDCRVHVEYEGQPAVDWYVPVGTPVRATMSGAASLYIVTVTNAFSYYGVSAEPYLGNPDRARAPLVPFPGPGGGKGVFVRIENEGFVTDYAHLEPGATVASVPPNAFVSGYSRESDYRSLFAPMRDFQTFTLVARWSVRRGDVIGFVDDSGYSEAPHLHYTVRRAGSSSLLCPTNEPGFSDAGWLFR